MKIRDLIKSGDDKLLSAILDEYSSPLDKQKAMHLLRRLTFHPTPEQVNQIAGKTAAEAFDIIIGNGTETIPDATSSMKTWLDKLEENPLDNLPQDIKSEIEGRHQTHFAEFINWWLDNMRVEGFPAIEKLTLFLSTIWCIEFTYDTLAYMPPPLLYRNNKTLRTNRLGDYDKIASAVAQDGSMILYQSLFFSNKVQPNENFMRELMELFTMGIGDLQTGASNYTEGDIREGARALTGWRTVAYLGQNGAPANKPFETFFMKTAHDTGGKKLFQFGEIAPITDDENTEDLVRNKEVSGLINILFEERGISIARFICEKIIRYFVYSDPGINHISIINELAEYMKDNGYNLRQVYKKLFTSQFFFSDDFMACQIKTPPEYMIGLERMLGIDYDTVKSGNSRNSIFSLEQILYDPPNVGSWKGYRNWISTSTYPLRIKYAKEMISKLSDSQLTGIAKKFPEYNTNVQNLTGYLTEYFLPMKLPQSRLDRYKSILLNGLNEAQWTAGIDGNNTKVAEGIKFYLNNIVSSPDFQLC